MDLTARGPGRGPRRAWPAAERWSAGGAPAARLAGYGTLSCGFTGAPSGGFVRLLDDVDAAAGLDAPTTGPGGRMETAGAARSRRSRKLSNASGGWKRQARTFAVRTSSALPFRTIRKKDGAEYLHHRCRSVKKGNKYAGFHYCLFSSPPSAPARRSVRAPAGRSRAAHPMSHHVLAGAQIGTTRDHFAPITGVCGADLRGQAEVPRRRCSIVTVFTFLFSCYAIQLCLPPHVRRASDVAGGSRSAAEGRAACLARSGALELHGAAPARGDGERTGTTGDGWTSRD